MQQKKHRTSGSETIAYLRQRAEENMKIKVEEQQAQRDMQVSFQQQQQMLHAFHKQSEQQHNVGPFTAATAAKSNASCTHTKTCF